MYGEGLEVELIDGRDGIERCKGAACLVRFEVLRSNAAFSKVHPNAPSLRYCSTLDTR